MSAARTSHAVADEPRSGFGAALRDRTFAVLYLAETQSIAGDQLARIALSFLVFDRTGSPSYTAAVYALTFLPAMLGGFVLARIGDHLPRRAVMVGVDLVRAGLFAAMTLSGVPLWAMAVLLAVAVFFGPAFTAAEVSHLAACLEPDVLRAGMGLRMVSSQAAQVAGFAVGGALVATIDPRGALAVNAATFVVSAAFVAFGLGPRRPAGRPAAASTGPRHGGARWWSDRRVVALLALSALQGLFVVPEGLAVPYADQVGTSTSATGILLAAIPLGGVIGAWAIVHLVPAHRQTFDAHVMAVLCGLPLILTTFEPDWRVASLLWLLSGALAAYQVEAVTQMIHAVPDSARAGLVGAGSAVLLGAQGLGTAAFGVVADRTSAATAIAVAGAVGSVLALGLVLGPLRGGPAVRTRRPRPVPRTRREPYVPRHVSADEDVELSS